MYSFILYILNIKLLQTFVHINGFLVSHILSYVSS